jgi:hypothetical protein
MISTEVAREARKNPETLEIRSVPCRLPFQDRLSIAVDASNPCLGPVQLCHIGQIEHVANLLARWTHAAATTSCHVCIADVLKAWCVLADVR